LCQFVLPGYALTVAVEAPILVIGLSRRHSWRLRLFAGFWLTACTYPVVVLVLPLMIESRMSYLVVAEILAPSIECLLFAGLCAGFASDRGAALRDAFAIVLANLASFGAGELLRVAGTV
jgi:hypothetical protein